MKNPHILILNRYEELGASSRYRMYQYLPYLQDQGFQYTVLPLLDNDYLQAYNNGKRIALTPIIQSYIRRLASMLRSKYYDLIWVEKECLPWVPGWIETLLYRASIPYVVDYDDAWFHRYDRHRLPPVRWFLGNKIARIMRHASLVVAGNEYLADYARTAGARRVEIVPSVVDLERYPLKPRPENEVFTIGWIGSRSTTRFLSDIQPALREICHNEQARLVTIGAGLLNLQDIPLIMKPWEEVTEVAEMQKFDVGIMPVPDTPAARGKCGLKLIQYMACACPSVGSPVGVNQNIIDHGVNGFHATTVSEWIEALQTLQQDISLRQRIGQAGRTKVEQHYALQVTGPYMMQLLSEIIS